MKDIKKIQKIFIIVSVILLAIVVYGLISRSFCCGVETKMTEKVGQELPPPPATQENPLTFTSPIILTSPGDTEMIKYDAYLSCSEGSKINILLDCVSIEVRNIEYIDIYRSSTGIVVFTVGELADEGDYVCQFTLECIETGYNDPTDSLSKDILIRMLNSKDQEVIQYEDKYPYGRLIFNSAILFLLISAITVGFIHLLKRKQKK